MEISAAVTPVAARTPARGAVLVVGVPAAESIRQLAHAASESQLGLRVATTLRDADAAIGDARARKRSIAAIVVDGAKSIESTCLYLRYNPEVANVPILGVVNALDDLGFEELYGAGGDDLCHASDREGIARRLRMISLAGAVPFSKPRGTAIVLDPDRRRRVLVARALRSAGFGVSFAVDGSEAIAKASEPGVELVVSSASFDEGGGSLVAARARSAGNNVPWIIASPPRWCARLRAAARGLSKVAVFDCFGAPENVLFVANELIRSAGIDARTSQRLLFGTTVRFRVAGSEREEVGFSYNVSSGGIYVRTLCPLPRGSEAWLELRPPRCDRRVRLEGRVVWTRAFGPAEAATVPPGFGVQLTGGSAGDLDRYERGCAAFAAEILG